MTPGSQDNPARPAKDCRTCNRRRIKCDRGLPTCKKCNDRDLPCPGYNVPLKWVQGVASRGKQKGRGFPIPEAPSNEDFSSGSSSSSGASPTEQSEPTEAEVVEEADTRMIVPEPSDIRGTATYDMEMALSLCPPQASEFLMQPVVRRMLHHFNHDVAPRLAWVDSSKNPFRNIILPLALESPSLLFSVLALAAGDLSFKADSETPLAKKSLAISTTYRDKALEILANQLRAENHEAGSQVVPVNHKPANSVLATTLMLFNLEVLQPGSTHWRLHLWAARTMIRRWGNTVHLPTPPDDTSKFLMHEFFVPSVCAFMTTFSDTYNNADDTLAHDNNSVFIEFHMVYQQVTNIERRRPLGSKGSPEDLVELHERLGRAKQRTLEFGQSLEFWSPHTRLDFAHVVDLYHHVGLIYSYQVIVGGSAPHTIAWQYRDTIFEHIRVLGKNNSFIQDLVWPLFIAGTESRGCPEEQAFVEFKFLEIIKMTGPLDRWQVISFLKAFWALEMDTSLNWIDFAREQARMGHTFMVY
ncbi:hypothetical protein PVAG01_02331 [Phlyctema vagabunda]|uniref:Zn(2)-C6 fungal-type domain-containing protein n=1 Tax=Phlyctema vagabunda TaxID=108571 RepID=A0ABR4PQJ2_9HELO